MPQGQASNSSAEYFANVEKQLIVRVAAVETEQKQLNSTASRPQFFITNYVGTAENDMPMFRTQRARSGTTVVQLGDKLGSYEFFGYTGSVLTPYSSGAGIKATAQETWDANSNGASVEIYTTPIGTTDIQPRLTVSSEGNVVVGNTALEENAMNGFLYIPEVPGIPSGVPTTFTGTVPICFNTATDTLYAYNGGWRSVALGNTGNWQPAQAALISLMTQLVTRINDPLDPTGVTILDLEPQFAPYANCLWSHPPGVNPSPPNTYGNGQVWLQTWIDLKNSLYVTFGGSWAFQYDMQATRRDSPWPGTETFRVDLNGAVTAFGNTVTYDSPTFVFQIQAASPFKVQGVYYVPRALPP